MAHQAFVVQDFDRAEALFRRLATEHPESSEGREAVFYLGAMHLDPRNPGWDPEPAEEHLAMYLSSDTVAPVQATRGPEAEILLELARQLNMPPQERVPGLQAETQVVVEEAAPERVVVPASESRALASEVARLRRDLAERDSVIQTQRAEIERIRKTLTGRDGG